MPGSIYGGPVSRRSKYKGTGIYKVPSGDDEFAKAWREKPIPIITRNRVIDTALKERIIRVIDTALKERIIRVIDTALKERIIRVIDTALKERIIRVIDTALKERIIRVIDTALKERIIRVIDTALKERIIRVIDTALKERIVEKKLYICQRHYRPDQILVNDSRTSVKPDEIPDLNLPTKGFPSIPFQPRVSASITKRKCLELSSQSSPTLSSSVYKSFGEFKDRICLLKLPTPWSFAISDNQVVFTSKDRDLCE